MTHWTQTPEGKAKVRRNARNMWKQKRAMEVSADEGSDVRKFNGSDEPFIQVNRSGGITTLVPGVNVLPYSSEGVTSFQLGTVVVEVRMNGRRVA